MVLADSKGMVYDFIPYTGKVDSVKDPTVPDLKDSSNWVLHLAQSILSGNNHLLFFHNWFTSLLLMSHLVTRRIWCCGTVRTPRLKGLKNGTDVDKELIKKGRGSYEELKSSNSEAEVTYVKWYDNKVVNIVATFAKTNPIGNVLRYDFKQKQKIEDVSKYYTAI